MSLSLMRSPKRRPWSERAKNRQAVETVKVQHVWKHAPRMFWGGILQIMSIAGYGVVWMSVGIVYLLTQYPADDPYASPFWESARPVVTIATGACLALYFISLAFTLPGKDRMKQALIPTRCQRCPKCFYDLTARPRGDDICPECGVVAPRRECVRLWCRLLRSRF